MRFGVEHVGRRRVAVRFGRDGTDDEKVLQRSSSVRAAFNSPFWPFVLVTTSVGQEGLDFHQYCHAVVHWNLPSNPVDLEQREGTFTPPVADRIGDFAAGDQDLVARTTLGRCDIAGLAGDSSLASVHCATPSSIIRDARNLSGWRMSNSEI